MSRAKRGAARVAAAASLGLALAGKQAAAERLPDFTDLVRDNSAAVVNISTPQELRRRPQGGGPEGSRPEGVRPQGAPGVPGKAPDLARPALPVSESGSVLRDFLGVPQGDNLHPRPPRGPSPSRSNPFARGRESLGSGFLIDADGVVLTNYHVVAQASEIVVRLPDGREYEAALAGSDERTDLAILQIDTGDTLPTVTIGNAHALEVGEWVLAIGSPFGFEHSVTAGIVSAKRRSLPRGNYVPYIQTDVAINPGNSGGPLFNLDGEVVGVNAQIYSQTGGFMGLSFAIPIGLAMDVANQLLNEGEVQRGWLGVMVQLRPVSPPGSAHLRGARWQPRG